MMVKFHLEWIFPWFSLIFPPFPDGAMWTPISQLDVDLQSLPTELSEECSLQRAPQGFSPLATAGFEGKHMGKIP